MSDRKTYVVQWDGLQIVGGEFPEDLRPAIVDLLDLHITAGWYEITSGWTPRLILPSPDGEPVATTFEP